MNYAKPYLLGVDIGGTNVAFGIVDHSDQKIIWKSSIPINQIASPEGLVELVFQQLTDQYSIDLIGSIGVGAPNGNFYSGCIEFAPNLPWKGRIPLAQMFESKFQVKTVLSNDANAAAVGEWKFGAGQDVNHLIMITLGTGVGSGLIVDGKLVLGADGMAGELGHFIVERNGRQCGCGRNGCLEAYTSATGLKRTYLDLANRNRQLVSEEITVKEIVDLALNRNLLAEETLEFTAQILGLALANFVTISNPEKIILFGGWAQGGDSILQLVEKYFHENLLKIYEDSCKVVLSQLPGSDVAIIGAASMGLLDSSNSG